MIYKDPVVDLNLELYGSLSITHFSISQELGVICENNSETFKEKLIKRKMSNVPR